MWEKKFELFSFRDQNRSFELTSFEGTAAYHHINQLKAFAPSGVRWEFQVRRLEKFQFPYLIVVVGEWGQAFCEPYWNNGYTMRRRVNFASEMSTFLKSFSRYIGCRYVGFSKTNANLLISQLSLKTAAWYFTIT